MKILRLSLQQYRSLLKQEFELHPRLTIFLGPNGSGKTNTLEAISLLSVPRSFRGSKDKELIAWEAEFGRVSGQITFSQGTDRELVVFLQQGKKLQVDGQTVPMNEFIGQFLSVLFAPEDVELLSGPPSRRRGFLDEHLSLLSPIYLQHLLDYQKILSRRNKLLSRQQWPSQDDLAYWNEQHIEHGVAIVEARLLAVEQINLALPSPMRLEYTSNLIGDESILETFHRKQAALIERERIVGHTLLGPHRDDWRLWLEPTVDAGVFGSRGQQRMGVIQLKKAQLQIIDSEKNDPGVLLLDDVLSELDAENQQRLLDSIDTQQTVITTASLADIPTDQLKDATIYEFKNDGWERRDV